MEVEQEDLIREGFICPICMKDLGAAVQLQKHFEDFHSDDKDALQQIRGMFGKAKRKILRKGEASDFDADIVVPSNGENLQGTSVARGLDPFLWDDQQFGASRSHFRPFRDIRDAEIDRFVVETNKILIRLEKLLKSGVHVTDSPINVAASRTNRKTVEKSLVPWTADSDVKFCPICFKQFNVAKRKHHCRLCGGIMCGKCSAFVSVSQAADIVKLNDNQELLPRRSKNSGKEESDDDGIRTCENCMELLERHERQERERQTQPVIVQLYKKMKSCMAEAESLHPVYIKMSDSINAGDVQYDLEETNQLRAKLLKIYEIVDLLSKKILSLGSDQETPPSAQTVKLQRGIKAFATGYLQENMFTLSDLPSRDKVKKLQEERALALARKAASDKAERERAMQQRLEASKLQHQRQGSGGGLSTPEPAVRPKTGQQTRAVGNGWGPVSMASSSSSPDPLIEQMDILKNYIHQARAQNKMDEVQMLERNLKELEQYWEQQQR